jgi:GT2 family glycosyltransferase
MTTPHARPGGQAIVFNINQLLPISIFGLNTRRMASCYVLIPFKDDDAALETCIESLLPQLTDGAEVVLVDDGSLIKAAENPRLQPFLGDSRVHLLSHECNLGAAQARNTGLAWCAKAGADLVILLDSDCLAKPGFVASHLALHRKNPTPPASAAPSRARARVCGPASMP